MSEGVTVGRHAVKELLNSDVDVNKVFIQEGANKNQLQDIITLAKKRKIVLQTVPRQKMDGLSDEKHQGVIALRSAHQYTPLDTLIEQLDETSNVIILDGLEDPHNLGSILRTADATGFKGVIIPKRRSVQLTDTVAKTSTGAISHVPVVRVTNLNQAIDKLKAHGLWIVGSDGTAHMDYREAPSDVNVALVIGSEGEGISKKTLDKCDFIVKIPMVGHVSSLNASVSASLLMYEIFRKQSPLKHD